MKTSVRTSLLWSGLAVLALGLPFGPDGGFLALRIDSIPSAEEATPDCGPIAVTDHPARARSRHLAALGVDRWHQGGWTGKGVKIAILDSGFRGYRGHLGKALPGQVLARCFRADGQFEARDSQHGILCGEILHALAPDASLLLATWQPDNSDQFLQAVRWARQQGARVISCSIIMPSWSDGEGGGPIHEALQQLVGDDTLVFASAGNTARRHWTGPFRGGAGGWHEWQAGVTENGLTPWGKERVSVELYWQPGCRFHLYVYDATTATEVGHSTGRCGPRRCHAVVRFQPEPEHRYAIRVKRVQGPTLPFHLVALGGNLGCATCGGSIAFPADGPEVIAVGAVDEAGRRASYSSCGPNSRCPKPDLVAPVPFPSLCRSRPFAGTSAAAPQAAALAALCWSRHPDWTATQVRQALRQWARDLGPPGHDWETGYGLATLPTPEGPSPARERPPAGR